uniref:DUF834 domain-containing protein n=1 Tax=Oryza meridionalis TaxID=40149 RepID=A0A0E0E6R9_9ORYZ
MASPATEAKGRPHGLAGHGGEGVRSGETVAAAGEPRRQQRQRGTRWRGNSSCRRASPATEAEKDAVERQQQLPASLASNGGGGGRGGGEGRHGGEAAAAAGELERKPPPPRGLLNDLASTSASSVLSGGSG